MSNSEWTELPNWKEPMEYAFLDSAEPELWAWEFLRRHPLYRRYWQRLSNFINKTEDNWNCTVYSPPKHSEETVKNWERRVWYHKNIFPTKTTLIERLGQKWGLQQLYDPSQQFNQGVRFHKPKRIFPRMVFTPEQFLELIEDEMLKDDIIQRVANGLAVVAFDMARPLDKQLKAAGKILFDWQDEMIKTGRVVPEEPPASRHQKWVRHLQVLDALRSTPPATYAEIGKMFMDSKKSMAAPEKKGEKFITAARDMMNGYQRILLSPSSN